MMQQQPEEQPTLEEIPVAEGNRETLKQALAEEKKRAENYLANWQRAQADLINYKRRAEQEKEENSKFANTTLMLTILPIIDDLERAFASIPEELAGQAWVDGIKLIGRKLQASLEAQGLSQVESLGKSFDPKFHEAAMQAPGKDGIVIQELQKGYTLHNRVIRPNKVVVGKGEIVNEEK